MKKHIIYLFLIFTGLWACNTEEVEVYTSQRYLFFPDSSKGLDTASFSFSHYPGATTHKVPFYLALTGLPLTEALSYTLEVIDSLTTAKPEDYEKPEGLLFPAGQTMDTLMICCKNTREELKTTRVHVTFKIVANANFQPGLSSQQTIRVAFDNIPSKPIWWKDKLEKFILGEYSPKKFEQFVIATGVNDLSEASLSEARELTMIFKVYLIENNIMEEDGETPMIDGIPCY